MDFETIHYEVKDAAASLILSRPAQSNALNARMLEEVNVAMDLAERTRRCGRSSCVALAPHSPRASTSRSRWSAGRPASSSGSPSCARTSIR